MFLKIKNRIINIALIKYIELYDNLQEIVLVFGNENLIIKFDTKLEYENYKSKIIKATTYELENGNT